MQANRESLDEAFLSSCFAYIKKASDDKITELVHALQKILQMFAAMQLESSMPPQPEQADTLLSELIAADESAWEDKLNDMIASGVMTVQGICTACVCSQCRVCCSMQIQIAIYARVEVHLPCKSAGTVQSHTFGM